MEDPNPDKNQKKSKKAWIAGIIVCIAVIYLIIGVVLAIVLVGDPPKGEKGLTYHFSIGSRTPVLSSETEILIPAIVDSSNTPVFSEHELNSHRVYGQYGLPDEYAYPCDVRYTTTKDGTMISLKPVNITDPRYFSFSISMEDYEGDSFHLSPVTKYDPQFLLNLYTFPAYIRNSTFTGADPVLIDSVDLGLSVCGYDPRDPYICKGYVSRPFQKPRITRELMPVLMNEYGEYNRFRRCLNPVTYPLVLLNPDSCA